MSFLFISLPWLSNELLWSVNKLKQGLWCTIWLSYIYIYIYIYICYHEYHVPSRLSPQWLCDNSCTWAHEPYIIFMITYILRSSCFCEIGALCVSWITYDHLYIYVYIYIYVCIYIYIYVYIYIYICFWWGAPEFVFKNV